MYRVEERERVMNSFRAVLLWLLSASAEDGVDSDDEVDDEECSRWCC